MNREVPKCSTNLLVTHKEPPPNHTLVPDSHRTQTQTSCLNRWLPSSWHESQQGESVLGVTFTIWRVDSSLWHCHRLLLFHFPRRITIRSQKTQLLVSSVNMHNAFINRTVIKHGNCTIGCKSQNSFGIHYRIINERNCCEYTMLPFKIKLHKQFQTMVISRCHVFRPGLPAYQRLASSLWQMSSSILALAGLLLFYLQFLQTSLSFQLTGFLYYSPNTGRLHPVIWA